MSSKIRLTEFADLTGVSPKEILLLIERGQLPLVDIDSTAVCVDLDSLDLKKVVEPVENKDNAESSICLNDYEREVFASELTKALEDIIRDAYELAQKWKK